MTPRAANHASVRRRKAAHVGALVRQHLDVGDATVIIDSYVDAFPADAAGTPLPVAMDAMADTVDRPERLDIQRWTRSPGVGHS